MNKYVSIAMTPVRAPLDTIGRFSIVVPVLSAAVARFAERRRERLVLELDALQNQATLPGQSAVAQYAAAVKLDRVERALRGGVVAKTMGAVAAGAASLGRAAESIAWASGLAWAGVHVVTHPDKYMGLGGVLTKAATAVFQSAVS